MPRQKLLFYVVLGFAVCIELFAFALSMNVPYIGFVFFVFLGIFSVSMIAQFWSYANEIYQREAGERLFPLIAVGSTAGGPIAAALAGVLFALPIIALGTYSLPLIGAGVMVFLGSKLAENSTDYSVMNTAKQMLWLPTSAEEKYKAKRAIDTFFVRAGDVIAAGLVFAGTTWLGLDVVGFSGVNVVLVLVWMVVAWMLLRKYKSVAGSAVSPPG